MGVHQIEASICSATCSKLGAIIGDNVQTGINACINVGSMIGNNTFIGPGAIASGVIAPDSRIFQALSVPDIVEKIFKEKGTSSSIRFLFIGDRDCVRLRLFLTDGREVGSLKRGKGKEERESQKPP
jgi:acyl-[acyl carrier protein]--UDP-N-acetylglucosamine O-acyltransferase